MTLICLRLAKIICGLLDRAGRGMECKKGIAKQLRTSMFTELDEVVLRERRTDQVRQTLQESSAAQSYALKDKRIVQRFVASVSCQTMRGWKRKGWLVPALRCANFSKAIEFL